MASKSVQYELSQSTNQHTPMDEMISITYTNKHTHPFIHRHIATTIALHPVVIPAGLIVPKATTWSGSTLDQFLAESWVEVAGAIV